MIENVNSKCMMEREERFLSIQFEFVYFFLYKNTLYKNIQVRKHCENLINIYLTS